MPRGRVWPSFSLIREIFGKTSFPDLITMVVLHGWQLWRASLILQMMPNIVPVMHTFISMDLRLSVQIKDVCISLQSSRTSTTRSLPWEKALAVNEDMQASPLLTHQLSARSSNSIGVTILNIAIALFIRHFLGPTEMAVSLLESRSFQTQERWNCYLRASYVPASLYLDTTPG